MGATARYKAALAAQRAPLPDTPAPKDLLRVATLAANAHNTQPWRFALHAQSIEIRRDASRKTPAVDPDDHHFYASLGCLAETLSIAARAGGLGGEVVVKEDPDRPLEVATVPGTREADLLFDAIPERQCTRSDYNGTGLAADLVDMLVAEAAVFEVAAIWIPAEEQADLTELVISGNTAQMRDAAFVAELKNWTASMPYRPCTMATGCTAPVQATRTRRGGLARFSSSSSTPLMSKPRSTAARWRVRQAALYWWPSATIRWAGSRQGGRISGSRCGRPRSG